MTLLFFPLFLRGTFTVVLVVTDVPLQQNLARTLSGTMHAPSKPGSDSGEDEAGDDWLTAGGQEFL